MKTDYDVVVFGGGTAGIPAAIQAARAGARTLLVERNAMLGGTMTLGGVNYPAHFFAWGKQLLSLRGVRIRAWSVGEKANRLASGERRG